MSYDYMADSANPKIGGGYQMKTRKKLPAGYTYRAKEDRYQCRFYYREKPYYVYGKTITECEAKKSEKIKQIEENIIDGSNTTLNAYYNMWIEEQKKSVKKSSVYSDEKSWNYIEKYFGNWKLDDIQKPDVIAMQNDLLKKHTPETVNKTHSVLKRILNSALRDGLISSNPAYYVKTLKKSKKGARDTNHRALTVEEQKLFFEYAKDMHYYNLFAILINTGMRVGEATALTWDDIDFKKKVINITKTVSRVSNTKFEVSDSPKTKSSRRIVPITDSVYSILMNQKAYNEKKGIDSEFIFTALDGSMTNYKNVDSAIYFIIKKINASGKKMDRFSVHAFRDTFATRCIEQGMSPNTLKEILGHSSIQITMDLYAHVMPNTKAREMGSVKIAI